MALTYLFAFLALVGISMLGYILVMRTKEKKA